MTGVAPLERQDMAARTEQRYAETEARWRAREAERAGHVEQLREGHKLGVDTPERTKSRLLRVLRTERSTSVSPAAVDALLDDLRPTAGRAVGELELGLERVIDRNDLVDISYLERGLRVARAVGRVVIGGVAGRPSGFGTGSLVSPQLLLTNNHVLPDAGEAARSGVEFGFQRGLDGSLRPGTLIPLDPDTFFLTDRELDFTLVAVRHGAEDLTSFGWNPLIEEEGKIILGESVSIIQHPGGEPKQLALRENQVIDLLDNFLHYRTDTAPGSSGSPVFNDQWEIVALHHSGVPRRDDQGRLLTRDGAIWTPAMGEQRIDWIGNEGIRISRIVKHLKAQALTGARARLRDDLLHAQELLMQIPNTRSESGTRSGEPNGIRRGESLTIPPQTAPAGDEAATLTIPLQVTIRYGHAAAGNGVTTAALSPRPPQGLAEAFETRLAPSLLNTGDVLLYRGTGWISQGIRFFDGTDYSHAGLYAGSGQVIEALGEGVVRRGLAPSTAGAEWVTVRRLKEPPADMDPVRVRGEFYLDQGNRYAYEQIVLLAILILVRKVSPNPVIAWVVRNAVSLATSSLTRLLGNGKQPMICSELVYRAYDEALPAGGDPFAIRIAGLPFEASREAGGRASERAGGLRGDGVHPGSLAVWAATSVSPLRGASRAAVAEGLEAAVAIDEAARRRELEESLAQYIETARTGRAPASVPRVREEEVRAEITRFVTHLYATEFVRGRVAGRETPRGTDGAETLPAALAERATLPDIFGAFFQAAADFVTPGDLSKTESLMTLGELEF